METSEYACHPLTEPGKDFGDLVVCNICGKRWVWTIDENDDPSGYWDED